MRRGLQCCLELQCVAGPLDVAGCSAALSCNALQTVGRCGLQCCLVSNVTANALCKQTFYGRLFGRARSSRRLGEDVAARMMYLLSAAAAKSFKIMPVLRD